MPQDSVVVTHSNVTWIFHVWHEIFICDMTHTQIWRNISRLRCQLWCACPCKMVRCVCSAAFVLQCVALYCSVLQCVAVCCSVSALMCLPVQDGRVCFKCSFVIQFVTVCYSVLQCVSVCYSIFQRSSVCFSVLQKFCDAVCCSELQCACLCKMIRCVSIVVLCCSVLHCVAVSCGVL